MLAQTSLWLLAPCSALSNPWAQWMCHTADIHKKLFPLDPVTL